MFCLRAGRQVSAKGARVVKGVGGRANSNCDFSTVFFVCVLCSFRSHAHHVLSDCEVMGYNICMSTSERQTAAFDRDFDRALEL